MSYAKIYGLTHGFSPEYSQYKKQVHPEMSLNKGMHETDKNCDVTDAIHTYTIICIIHLFPEHDIPSWHVVGWNWPGYLCCPEREFI